MKTLQLSEQKARELYRSGSKKLKTVLEESFGKDFFSQDVTERVKTYLDACHELGREPLDEKKLLELGLTEHDIASAIRIAILRLRVRVAGLAFV